MSVDKMWALKYLLGTVTKCFSANIILSLDSIPINESDSLLRNEKHEQNLTVVVTIPIENTDSATMQHDPYYERLLIFFCIVYHFDQHKTTPF